MTSYHVWLLILSHNSNNNNNINNKHNTTPLWGQNTPPHILLPNSSVPLLPLTRGWRLVNSVHGSQRVTVGSPLGIQERRG